MKLRTLLVGGLFTSIFAVPVFSADAPSVFAQQCAMCHGPAGAGVPQLAPPLKGSEFIANASDEEITAVIRHGRAGPQKRYTDFPSVMPPFPNLSDEELAELAKYVRQLSEG